MSLEYTIITDVDNPLCGLAYEEVLQIVKLNGFALGYVKHQTPELCLAAVKENGFALESVEHQTPELCLAAVEQDGYALHYVKEQTPEICLAAVKKHGDALGYVQVQTPEICLEAVKQGTDALQYVNDQYLEYIENTLGVKNLAVHDVYALIYQKGAYRTDCHGPWTRQEALNHWDENHPNQERATLFRNAILNHVE
jgi:hypothetical protein